MQMRSSFYYLTKAKEEAEKRHSLSKMAQMQRENAKLKKKMIELEKNTPLDEEDEAKGDEEVGINGRRRRRIFFR